MGSLMWSKENYGQLYKSHLEEMNQSLKWPQDWNYGQLYKSHLEEMDQLRDGTIL